MSLDVEWTAIGFSNLRSRENFLQFNTPPTALFCLRRRGCLQQFRSIETVRMVKKEVPLNRFSMKADAAAAEVALKAHILAFDPEILADMTDGTRMMQEIASAVDLTEAPEDAVCSLVTDLLQTGENRLD